MDASFYPFNYSVFWFLSLINLHLLWIGEELLLPFQKLFAFLWFFHFLVFFCDLMTFYINKLLFLFHFLLRIVSGYFLCGYSEAYIKDLIVITVYSKLIVTSITNKNSPLLPLSSYGFFLLDVTIYIFYMTYP